MPSAFTGKVNNSANVGKIIEEIVALWNEEHPLNTINSTTPGPNPF